MQIWGKETKGMLYLRIILRDKTISLKLSKTKKPELIAAFKYMPERRKREIEYYYQYAVWFHSIIGNPKGVWSDKDSIKYPQPQGMHMYNFQR